MTNHGEGQGKAIRKAIKKEYNDFVTLCPKEQEPVLSILRAHLLTEYYMERILLLKLPRGDKVIDGGKLTYAQKISLLEALDILKDKIVQCLKNLNSVRNHCAHELNKNISLADIEAIGRPLGQEYTKLYRKHSEDHKLLLWCILSFVCRDVVYTILALEKTVAEDREK